MSRQSRGKSPISSFHTKRAEMQHPLTEPRPPSITSTEVPSPWHLQTPMRHQSISPTTIELESGFHNTTPYLPRTYRMRHLTTRDRLDNKSNSHPTTRSLFDTRSRHPIIPQVSKFKSPRHNTPDLKTGNPKDSTILNQTGAQSTLLKSRPVLPSHLNTFSM